MTRRVTCLAAALVPLSVVLAASTRPVDDRQVPRGVLVPDVICLDDPAEHYALYLPSDYTPDRAWSLLLAFHPAARGADFVETYRAAAERYGYIVAASNTSRNGSWEVTTRAVRALSRDVGKRFAVDAQRVYLTGHSGGARVAMEVALGPNDIAGVIASSAGFPDGKPRGSVRFPVFATAGVDDFNYLEMRRLDDRLSSPHLLAVFDGGHTLPPDAVAKEAIEWMELQAMRSGRRERDPALVEAIYTMRRQRAHSAVDLVLRLRLLRGLVADFEDLRDTTAEQRGLEALSSSADARRAVDADRADLDAESRALDEALALEARLRNAGTRVAALSRLSALFEEWSRAASAEAPSPTRSRARRLLGAVRAGAASRVEDQE